MGVMKNRKLGVMSKIVLFSKTVQDFWNRSAEMCLVMLEIGLAGHSLSMFLLQSLFQPGFNDYKNIFFIN